MLRAKKIFLVSLLLLLSCRNRSQGPTALAEHVADGACSSWFNSEKNFEEMESRLEILTRDRAQESDRALVMLTGYYLGEHNGEVLTIEIVRRGKRMEPLLKEEQQVPILLKTCAPTLESNTRRAIIADMLDLISRGERFD